MIYQSEFDEDLFPDQGLSLPPSPSYIESDLASRFTRNPIYPSESDPNSPEEVERYIMPPVDCNNLPMMPNEPINAPQHVNGAHHQQSGSYKLSILGIPQKSRVETQLKMCLRLHDKNGKVPNSWPCLKLDSHLVAPAYLRRKLNAQKQKEQSKLLQMMQTLPVLLLKAEVIRASPPHSTVYRCYGCIKRELKTVERKIKKMKNGDTNPEVQLNSQDEVLKILQFYTEPVLDFSAGEIILPVRVTCYCRHHKETNGFVIRISLYDEKSNTLIVSGQSTVIMITDDHKSTKKRPRSVSVDISSLPHESEMIVKNSPPLTSPIQQNFHPNPYIQTHSIINTTSPNEYPKTKHKKIEDPIIQRVIPYEGPTSGGIEITLLGSNFRSNLRCYFGDIEAPSTHYWAASTLVVILPPSIDPGPVLVTLKDLRDPHRPIINPCDIVFTYVNQSDRQLLELALQVIGMKLNGRVDNAIQVARQIMINNSNAYNFGFPSRNEDRGEIKMESIDIKQIENAIKYTLTLDTEHLLDLSIQNKNGHQLLHLCVLENHYSLFTLLLDNAEYLDIDVADNNGWTALHFAAHIGRYKMVKKLLNSGALPNINNENGDFPVDLTKDPAIIDLFNDTEFEEISLPIESPLPPSEDHIIDINTVDGSKIQENTETNYQKQPPMMKMWLFFTNLLFTFWKSYRAFLYIGILLATGSWTLIDYIPSILGGATTESLVDTTDWKAWTTVCNPPTPACGGPNTSPRDHVPNLDSSSEGFFSLLVEDVEGIVLSFGQFLIFILCLTLILFHFKDRFGVNKFWASVVCVILFLLIGSLFIFEVL